MTCNNWHTCIKFLQINEYDKYFPSNKTIIQEICSRHGRRIEQNIIIF